MGSNGRLEFRYGTSMNDEYQFTITPTEAKLLNYIRFGNASSSEHETKLAQASLQIVTNEWFEIEFGMQGHLQWLSINGEVKIHRETARFYGVDIKGAGEIYLDDIQLIQNNLSANGEILASYPEGLTQTWIAYLDTNNELAIVHPDGTDVHVVTAPSTENFSILSSFSPNGKMLLVSKSNGEQTLLSFFSMEELQFVGSEILLPRWPLYDWMPDGEHVIVLRDTFLKSVSLEKVNIHSGQVVATYILPQIVDEQTFEIESVNSLDCSSNGSIIILELRGNLDGNTINRSLLFNLTTQQANYLPGAFRSLWSPDGTLIFSTAGGLIDPQSFVFTELPDKMVKRISNYQGFAWSPNGQFIHVGTENSGNEAYAVYILDLESKDVINLHQNSFGTFAPDSLHFVFGDSGRVIVRSLFDNSELQIAQGTKPIWQPAPDYFSIDTILQGQPTNSNQNQLLPTIETTHADSTTGNDEKDDQHEIVPSDNGLSGIPPKKNHRPTWPTFFGILSLIGLAVTVSYFYLNFFRRCPSCQKTNRGSDLFCMYCGNPLKPFARPIKTRIVIAMLIFSGSLTVAVIAVLVNQPAQNILMADDLPYKPSLENLGTETIKTITENARPSSKFFCGKQDLSNSTLPEILQEIETNQAEMSEYIAQAYNRTPEANTTREASLQETQSAELNELSKKMCFIASLSISPDQRYILVSGSYYMDGTGLGFWSSLYDRTNYNPIWVKPIEINSRPSSEIEWNSSGDAFAVIYNSGNNEGKAIIFETSSGNQISEFAASTRRETYCSPLNLEGNQYHWTLDGNHLVKKITNAVQVLNVSTGAVEKEIAFDDDVMGSQHFPPEDRRCFFRLAWDANGNRLATLDASGKTDDNPTYNGLKIWNSQSGNLLLENRSSWINSHDLSFSPDGKFLLVFGFTTSLIDTSNGQVVNQLSTCPVCNYPDQIIWSKSGEKILILEGKNIGMYDFVSENWKMISFSEYSGQIHAWLEESGDILMCGTFKPVALNILTGKETPLLEYFKSYK